jgi:hypothetical protein
LLIPWGDGVHLERDMKKPLASAILWEGTAPWLWQDRGSRRFLEDREELGFRAAAWWWEENP